MTDEQKQEYYEYLDELRESGEVNMLGAAPYLATAFGLSKVEAREVHANWMQDFGKDES